MEQNHNKDVKHVYVRERQTDDVFRFWIAATADQIQAQERGEESLPVPESKPRNRKLLASSATFALLLVATIFAAGITTTHQTLSYFNDVEASNANSLNAGILDLQINGVDFDGEVTEGQTGVVIDPALSGVAGNFDMEYKVRAEKISGPEPFCSLIQAHVEGDLAYDGPLLSFVGGPSISVGTSTFALSLPNATGVANGDVCDIDLVYTAWAKHAVDEQGYVDQERVRITLTAIGLPEQAPAFLRAFSVFSTDEGASAESGDEHEADGSDSEGDGSDEKEDKRGRDVKDEREERDERERNSVRSESDDTDSAEDVKKDDTKHDDKKDKKEESAGDVVVNQESVPPADVPPPAEPVTETPATPEIPQEPVTPTSPAVETPPAPAASPDPIE